tara:strand:+ start:35582 stop:35806 length:225 start_codon:yes stop_codon:yes gene_type:complete
MKIILKKGQKVFLSHVGHKNFWYPSSYDAILLDEAVGEKMAWAGGGGLVPLKIDSRCISRTSDSSHKTVIWVNI